MISLLEVDPDFAALLPAAERRIAGNVSVHVRVVGGGSDANVGTLLREAEAFGATILDGLLVQRLRLRDQVGVRLLGAGDVVMPGRDPHGICLAESELTASPGTRLALFGEETLLALRRWPVLMLRMLQRATESFQMLESQMVICQLPRVDQRLPALLWLLAERWGRVTSIGTYLPIALTHETLGALIGARRPTITLALAELADRGEVIRHGDGWLLPGPAPLASNGEAPEARVRARLHSDSSSPRDDRPSPPNGSHATVAANITAINQSRAERVLSATLRRRATALCARSQRLLSSGTNTAQRERGSTPRTVSERSTRH